MKVIVDVGGINWCHYEVFMLSGATATLIEKYRIHKGESGHPDEAITGRTNTPRYMISEWKKDGMPGGIRGLKDNYKIKKEDRITTLYTYVNSKEYKVQ